MIQPQRRLFLTWTLCVSTILSTFARTQDTTFEFQLPEMKPEIADFLENRLLAGGGEAAEAEGKLPGLIQKHTILRLAELKFNGGDRFCQQHLPPTLHCRELDCSDAHGESDRHKKPNNGGLVTPMTMKELLLAGGIKLPPSASAHYNAGKGQVALRLPTTGH